uniref:Bm9485 n=1 Tax=Brugia malayi TaxID=6279 RepID=A0A1S0T0E4_BRUMA|nr:Bm9485 [Brugia malayi]
MIDLGIGFADETMPGIELLIADVSFIAQGKEDLFGIIRMHMKPLRCSALTVERVTMSQIYNKVHD